MTACRFIFPGIVFFVAMSMALESTMAEQVNPEILTMQGTVQYIDGSNNELVVDDRTLKVARDVVVISQYGKTTNLSALFPGKRVQMQVEYPPEGNAGGTIRRIELLK